MFQPSSRYAPLAVKTITVPGQGGVPTVIRYVERRFLPSAGAAPTIVEHTVAQGDRLDNITARYLGDPTQFWRIADANDTSRPEELTDEPGGGITIALPQ